jgi:hypothetical protein
MLSLKGYKFVGEYDVFGGRPRLNLGQALIINLIPNPPEF